MQPQRMIEEDLAVRLRTHDILSTGVTPEAIKFFTQIGKDYKNKAAQLAAENEVRQKRISHLNDIIKGINAYRDPKTGNLDLNTQPELQKKLRDAVAWGVEIQMDEKSTKENPLIKTSWTSDERELLLQNLSISKDEWTVDNKQQAQKMQTYLDESNRIFSMVMQCKKDEDKAKRTMIQGMGK